MEKLSSYRCNSPVKSVRKGEYKVQFADASEYYKGRSSITGKPPEVPRSNSTSLRSNSRHYTANSSTSNLSTCHSSSVGSKLNRGSSSSQSSSSAKYDTFGSTTSLDRRRQGSKQNVSAERALQPISNAKRTQSLDRRRLERSLYESSSSLTAQTGKRRKDRCDYSGDKKLKSRSPYAASLSVNNSVSLQHGGSDARDRSKTHSRPRTSHPNLQPSEQQPVTKSLSLVDSHHNPSERSYHHDGGKDWLHRIKRASSKSPNRKGNKSSITKEEEKENAKKSERSSRRNEDRRHDRERGRSLKRENGRLAVDHWNNNNL